MQVATRNVARHGRAAAMTIAVVAGVLGLQSARPLAIPPAPAANATVMTNPVEASRAALRPSRKVVHIHTNVMSATFDTYCALATDVLHGYVIGQEVLGGENEVPVTRVAIKVVTSAFDRLGGIQFVSVLGGETESVVGICTRAPRFEEGEEVLLFLCGDPDGQALGILGLDQGTYRIRPNSTGAPGVYGKHAGGEGLATFFDHVRQAAGEVRETKENDR